MSPSQPKSLAWPLIRRQLVVTGQGEYRRHRNIPRSPGRYATFAPTLIRRLMSHSINRLTSLMVKNGHWPKCISCFKPVRRKIAPWYHKSLDLFSQLFDFGALTKNFVFIVSDTRLPQRYSKSQGTLRLFRKYLVIQASRLQVDTSMCLQITSKR